MKKAALYAVTGIASLSAHSAHAANWVETAHAKDKSIYYYDASGLKAASDIQVIWVKSVWPKVAADGSISSTGRYRFSCSAMSYTPLAILSHRPDGTVTYSRVYESYEQKSQVAAPDTVFEWVMQDVCAAAGS